MEFVLGASVLLNILLFAVIRVLTTEIKVEIERFKENFRILLEDVEVDYRVNGTEHKLFSNSAYKSVQGYLYK